MNKLENIFNGAKNEIEKLWNENSALWDFVEFPKDLQLKNFNANKIPAADKLFNWKSNLSTDLKELHQTICNLSPYVNWEYDSRK